MRASMCTAEHALTAAPTCVHCKRPLATPCLHAHLLAAARIANCALSSGAHGLRRALTAFRPTVSPWYGGLQGGTMLQMLIRE
jgi:hypothetical protein